MRPRQIEAMLDYLETALADVVKWSDRAEPQRKRGLCIGTSRTAILALREVGLRADALPVQLAAYSPAYVAMMEEAHERHRQPTSAEVLDWQQQGAWAVVIGPANLAPLQVGSGGYNGHVVVAVERRWVIDLTLGQASRPEKCVPLPATAWMECPPLAQAQGARGVRDRPRRPADLRAHRRPLLPASARLDAPAPRRPRRARPRRTAAAGRQRRTTRPLRIPPVAVRA